MKTRAGGGGGFSYFFLHGSRRAAYRDCWALGRDRIEYEQTCERASERAAVGGLCWLAGWLVLSLSGSFVLFLGVSLGLWYRGAGQQQ